MSRGRGNLPLDSAFLQFVLGYAISQIWQISGVRRHLV